MAHKIKVGFREQAACVVAETSYEVTGDEVSSEQVLIEAEKLALQAQTMTVSMTMRKRK